MRPGTRHYILATQPTQMYGRHFYCSHTLDLSVCSMVHTLVSVKTTGMRHTDYSHLHEYLHMHGRWFLDTLERVNKHGRDNEPGKPDLFVSLSWPIE